MKDVIFQSSSLHCYSWETPAVLLHGGSDHRTTGIFGHRNHPHNVGESQGKGPIKRLSGHRGPPCFPRRFPMKVIHMILPRKRCFLVSVWIPWFRSHHLSTEEASTLSLAYAAVSAKFCVSGRRCSSIHRFEFSSGQTVNHGNWVETDAFKDGAH